MIGSKNLWMKLVKSKIKSHSSPKKIRLLSYKKIWEISFMRGKLPRTISWTPNTVRVWLDRWWEQYSWLSTKRVLKASSPNTWICFWTFTRMIMKNGRIGQKPYWCNRHKPKVMINRLKQFRKLSITSLQLRQQSIKNWWCNQVLSQIVRNT